ncbi:MAG: hypothetical protein Q7R60_00710 [bacterium]|nr:hypothetical protein [bacterium]
MKTVAILHGWAGGWWHAREFTQVLNENGLRVIKNASAADVIFAHSTGCYRVPEDNKAELIILQGPPYWPSKSILHRLFMKKGHDIKLRVRDRGILFTVNKFIWEVIYVVIKPGYMFVAVKNHRYLHFLDLLKDKKAILVRNEEDYFCSPEIEEAIKEYKNVRYVSLPGGHDDFMTNPQPYIDLIRKAL